MNDTTLVCVIELKNELVTLFYCLTRQIQMCTHV